jgi:quinoprotein glucose dehydrogenase
MVRLTVFLVVGTLQLIGQGQGKRPARIEPADWPNYNRDLAGTRYSPLTQINTQNVARLKLAWSYSLTEFADPTLVRQDPSTNQEGVPLVVNGVMYLTAGDHILALDCETGKMIWQHRLDPGMVASRRGVAFWPGDRQSPPRILYTFGSNQLPATGWMNATKLTALNAKTGNTDPGFGQEGVVDMGVAYGGVPTIFQNVVIVGSAGLEHAPLGFLGDTRAFDARTGGKLWSFHSVPQPGELGHDTWEGESWKDRSGVNTWGFQMAVDEQRGILYMPLGSPSSNYYGGDRKGANLFGSSLVALDAKTGKYLWHFQTIHHDIWDYDLPPAPSLIDIVRNGQKVPALAEIGKTSLMFILDRATGKPVFGVEERPALKSDVPGEETFPTQPFPLKPPPLARTSYKPEDLVTEADTNAEHAKACQALVDRSGGLYNRGLYTPWLYRPEGSPPRSTISFPGAGGGTNWGGTASDPKSSYVYAFTQDAGSIGRIQMFQEGGHRVVYVNELNPLLYDLVGDSGAPGSATRFAASPHGPAGEAWPCQKPPWSRLSAVNANTGEIAWQVPVGVTDELPEGKRNTGRPGTAGPMVTAGGLVFLGATNDRRFRAFDAKTGKELWVTKMEYSANANPITFLGKNGKQYVAIVAGLPPPGALKNQQTAMVYSLP